MRLDAWLHAHAFFPSRKAAKAALDTGLIKVGGKRVVIAKWALKSGDVVETRKALPTDRQRERAARNIHVDVLHEDRDVICVNKPAGVAVVATGHTATLTMVDLVRSYLRRKHKDSRGTFVRALHRLDVETSGAVLMAKSKVGEGLSKQFKMHSIDRRYSAIVSGVIEEEDGTISMSVQKGEYGFGRKVAPAPLGSGKRAVTHFTVTERYRDACLLDVRVETGRTHQIRVHFASLGHPLVGDTVYGLPDGPKAPRLMLHAGYLKFYLPNGGKMECRAPIPADMQGMIEDYRERC